MKKKYVYTLFLIVVAIFVSGCFEKIEKTKDTISDAVLSSKVKYKLAKYKLIYFSKLEVISNNGVILLKGNVNTVQDKVKAGKIARQTKGVKKVINQLEVIPQKKIKFY